MDQKSVLCFGDSNTWGYIPGSGGLRYSYAERWTGVLAQRLGADWLVLEEGLNGRCTAYADPLEPPNIDRNGRHILPVVLESHKPLDYVIIALGTNDCKTRVGVSVTDIAMGIEFLVQVCRDRRYGRCGHIPRVLAVCPAPILEVKEMFGPEFRGGREKSIALAAELRRVALRSNFPVLYAGEILESDPADGLHLSAASHAALGNAVADWLQHSAV